MPPVTAVSTGGVSGREEDSMNNEPSLSGRQVIGLIYPPPEIRTIVDKTAGFVARNGIDFENRIRERESGNPRFNFLSPTDPYNAYYQHKVRELQEGKSSVESSLLRPQLPEAVKEAVKKAEFIPTKPPSAFEFSADPTTINAFDLDLIKLTALFVARNGRPFLTQLMNREIRNYQFDFLKPQHSNFTYFTKLVEQYTKVAIPVKTVVDELRAERLNHKKLLEDIRYRVDWEKHQKGLKDKEAAEAEKERLAYASIDWHDFVVVQTVDFQPGDIANLPGMCTPKDVGTRILQEQREEQHKAAAQPVEMDMEESDDEGEETVEAPPPPAEAAPEPVRAAHEMNQPAPLPPTKQNVIVRDFDPRKNQPLKKQGEKWLVSPLTQEWVPSDKIEEHIRYNTMDSQYKEERERGLMERTNEEPVFAPGAEVGKNLASFAKRRTDIFGVGEQGAQQTMIGQTFGDEEEARAAQPGSSSNTRDGPSLITPPDQPPPSLTSLPTIVPPPKSAASSSAPPLPSAPPPSIPAPSAIPPRTPVAGAPSAAPAPLASVRPPGPPSGAMNLPPLPGGAPPTPLARAMPLPMSSVIPQAMPPPIPSQIEIAPPPAKKTRTEDDLLSESEWLSKVPAQIEVRVLLPTVQEWNMNGDIVAFAVESAGQVSSLKAMIQDKYGMPNGKQKLSFENIFMKDANTFAFYNVANQGLIQLLPKERGGKKK